MVVWRDGELEVERVFCVELREIWQHRRGVFRPEDDAVDILRPQRDAADLLAVEWVDGVDESRADAVHEPRCIESRDVRPATGTDNRRGHFLSRGNVSIVEKEQMTFESKNCEVSLRANGR